MSPPLAGLPEGPEPERIWRFRVWMDAEGVNVVVARQTDGILVLSADGGRIAAEADLVGVVTAMLRPGGVVGFINLAPDALTALEQHVAAGSFRVY